MSAVELSVVMAVPGPGNSVAQALVALERGCDAPSTEVIVVVAAAHDPAGLPGNVFGSMRVARAAPGTLTPVLWGTGASMASGRVVAFTTDQMRVTPGWGSSLRRAIADRVVGAAGPIELAPGADAATTAAYYMRFSAYAPDRWPAPAAAPDIPGDNAAYDRAAVVMHSDLLGDGFWEVEFHRRFHQAGLVLNMVPAARGTLVGPVPFAAMAGQRFRHGKEFGASRVTRHGESPLRVVLAAPVVPLVLLARIGRRALAVPHSRGRFISALPLLAVLATTWAAGELAGALSAGKSVSR